jgi:hypothetical protein
MGSRKRIKRIVRELLRPGKLGRSVLRPYTKLKLDCLAGEFAAV